METLHTTPEHQSHSEKIRFPNPLTFFLNYRKVMKDSLTEVHPTLPNDPRASDLARSGWTDFKELQRQSTRRNNSDLLFYVYKLAKYISRFEGGEILVSPDGNVVGDGRHRVLALRVLGEDYVRKSGLDKRISVKVSTDLIP